VARPLRRRPGDLQAVLLDHQHAAFGRHFVRRADATPARIVAQHVPAFAQVEIRRPLGLLGCASKSTQEVEDAIGDIQESMLAALGQAGLKSFPMVARRVQFADDLQALWYLRGDLMAALADLHGEAHARETIRNISDQFQGLLPKGLSTRPSPLGK
jgi:hypothetical protein